MSRPENYKNTEHVYDLRFKGVGGFGSPSSRPPTQDEDHDLNQMIEQLQNQLGEEKRRITDGAGTPTTNTTQ